MFSNGNLCYGFFTFSHSNAARFSPWVHLHSITGLCKTLWWGGIPESLSLEARASSPPHLLFHQSPPQFADSPTSWKRLPRVWTGKGRECTLCVRRPPSLSAPDSGQTAGPDPPCGTSSPSPTCRSSGRWLASRFPWRCSRGSRHRIPTPRPALLPAPSPGWHSLLTDLCPCLWVWFGALAEQYKIWLFGCNIKERKGNCSKYSWAHE